MNTNSMKKFTAGLLLVLICLTSVFGIDKDIDPIKTSKKFIKDVEKITGELSEDQQKIARFAFTNTFKELGYSYVGELNIDKASKELSNGEYAQIVNAAAELAKNKAALAAINMGKAGEKLLKALGNTAEKALDAGKKWLDEASAEYDENH